MSVVVSCLVPRSSHAVAISNQRTCKVPENRLTVNWQRYSVIAQFGQLSINRKSLYILNLKDNKKNNVSLKYTNMTLKNSHLLVIHILLLTCYV